MPVMPVPTNTYPVSGFVEVQFPPAISYGSRGGGGFNTSVFTSVSGEEQRNALWSQVRGSWDVGYGITSADDFATVIAHFTAMSGKLLAFRFKAWEDYQAWNQQIAVADGSATQFQMCKSYTSGSQTYYRTIYKPVAGTLGTVLVNGVPTTDVTLDTTTGIFTFATAPTAGSAIVITYLEFDCICRWDIDHLDVTQSYWNAVEAQGLKIVELVGPGT